MLGARRTTVTLIAQSFQDAGMIKYRRGRIIICDAVKLQNVACECYRAVKSNYEALLPCPMPKADNAETALSFDVTFLH